MAKKHSFSPVICAVLLLTALLPRSAALAAEADPQTSILYRASVADHNDISDERSDATALAYYLRPTAAAQSDSTEICALARTLTAQCGTDVEKALAIHDWVCDNIYYDFDVYYKRTKRGDCSALGVLQSRKSVCSGYANLTAALLKAAGIPARTVSGYALGLSAGNEFPQEVIEGIGQSNHAWNMAFIDGKWTYIDTTWDSGNKWEFGKVSDDRGCYRHTYFMIAGDLLAEDHATLIRNSYGELQLYVDYPECWDGTAWHSLNSAAPTVINGTAMVPLRGVIEGMGGTVVYDAQSNPPWAKITCKVGTCSLQM